jgi:riboflavin synthase
LQVGEDWFNVYLIPETMRVTVLGIKQKGDTVNIEIDAQTQAIVTAVERVVESMMHQQTSAATATSA